MGRARRRPPCGHLRRHDGPAALDEPGRSRDKEATPAAPSRLSELTQGFLPSERPTPEPQPEPTPEPEPTPDDDNGDEE